MYVYMSVCAQPPTQKTPNRHLKETSDTERYYTHATQTLPDTQQTLIDTNRHQTDPNTQVQTLPDTEQTLIDTNRHQQTPNRP